MSDVQDPHVDAAGLTPQQLVDIVAREQEVAALEASGQASEHSHLPFDERPSAR